MAPGNILIDPPVSPFSPPGEIKAWIRSLKNGPQNDDIRRAIKRAEEWLKHSQDLDR